MVTVAVLQIVPLVWLTSTLIVIVTVSPGKGGLGTYAPPLDAAGNSVRGQLLTKYLAERLGQLHGGEQ